MKPRVTLILGLMLAWLAASSGLAEVVRMKDGREIVGTIREETTDAIIVETTISGILTTLTLKRASIEGIFHGDGPAVSSEADGTQEKPARSSSAYMEVPIIGTFGEDILPDGVAEALSLAVKYRIDHVVFVIDSPGGEVAAAQQIAEVMRRYHGRLQLHALVRKAISASIWVVFSCDDIFIQPGAGIGAAVAFSQDQSTGEVEVDAKMNSALAGDVVAAAEMKGHSAVLVRAMMLPEASAYAWRQGVDRWQVTAESPVASEATEVIQLDDKASVLTLTAEDAARLGVASLLEAGSAEAIGGHLGVAGWRKRGDYGRMAMQKAAAARRRVKEETAAAVRRVTERPSAVIQYINDNIAEAQAQDPANFTYYYYEDTGLYTWQSQQRWRLQSDLTIAAWMRVIAGLRELASLEQEADRLGLERIVHDIQIADYAGYAQREITRLRSEYYRSSP